MLSIVRNPAEPVSWTPMTISELAGVERPDAVQHAQGSYRALFESDWPSDLSRAERFAVAAHVAELHQAAAPAAHYRARLGAGQPSGARWTAIERHADLLALKPVEATPDHLQALADAGLGTTSIVTLSQVIAFVSFEVRLLAGLQLLGAAPDGP